MRLKEWHNFLAAILRANMIHSKSVYRVSTSVNILLTKYTCLCLQSSLALTRSVITVVVEAVRYK